MSNAVPAAPVTLAVPLNVAPLINVDKPMVLTVPSKVWLLPLTL